MKRQIPGPFLFVADADPTPAGAQRALQSPTEFFKLNWAPIATRRLARTTLQGWPKTPIVSTWLLGKTTRASPSSR